MEVGAHASAEAAQAAEGARAMPPRKAALESTPAGTVPQTDTGGWVEQTKVRERNHVKELGKIVP